MFVLLFLGGCGTTATVVDPKDPASTLNPAMPASEKNNRLHGHAPKSAG